MDKKSKHYIKIRTKIMLINLGFSILLIAVILPSIFYSVSGIIKENLDNQVEMIMDTCEEDLIIKDGELYLQNPDNLEEALLRNGGIFVRIYGDNGKLIYSSYGAEEAFSWSLYEDKLWKSSEREVSIGQNNEFAIISVIGSIYYNNILYRIFMLMVWFLPGYLIVSAIFSYVMARRMLRPISDITSTAKEIKNGNWKRRIEGVNKQDELGKLAAEFNEMITKIDESYTRERRFISDASHELRTPLSIVSACTEEALNTDKEELIQENLETILCENKRMSKIISQLLTLSRGYEGNYNFEPEQIILDEAVDSVAEILEEAAMEKNIVIHNEVKSNSVIRADQGMYTQILINVIGNAIKYGKQNGNVWIKNYEDDKYYWLEIKDDGIGMSEENASHIFERFYRADSARNRDGSGLGLSIVKWMVEIHRGDIKVTSKLNEGTSILIGIGKDLTEKNS